MDEAVENGVGDCRVADGLMPLIDRQLAGDDGGCLSVPILEDFQQVTPLLGIQDGQAPIVENEHLCAFDGFQDAGVPPITPCEGEGLEEPGGAVIHHATIISAGLVPKSAGNPTLAQSCLASDQ